MVITAGPRVDVQRFEQDGYLLIEDVFDPVRDLDPVVAEYAAKLDRVATQWATDGTIASAYAALPFTQRFAHILNDTGAAGYRPFDICLGGPFRTDEPLDASMHAGPAVFNLIRHPRLLDVIERLIGGEILSNPIQHVRIKPPEAMLRDELTKRNTMMAAVAWHQDQGVALPEIDVTDILTVWFPVLDATVENGCLCVIPGSHHRGMLLHCPAKPDQSFDLRIPDEIRGAGGFPVPMRRGSILVMHRLTMHSSLPNRSDGVRWSFDLRYQPVGQPTGRPWFPSFVARSRQDPSQEIRDWRTWASLWETTRLRLADDASGLKPRRWTGTEEACA